MADPVTPETPAATDADKGATPPWGDDFNAERAWALVQNLRAEKETLKGQVGTLETERQAREASTTDGQKELQARAEAAETRAKTAERALTLSKVLNEFPELADFEDLLTGDTEEEIKAKAERLAAIGGKKADVVEPAADAEKTDVVVPDADVVKLPVADLQPGHGGEQKVEFDPAAIATAARATR
jgi:hypothetical protein